VSASEQLGYEARRAELEQYLDEHYIARFDIAPCALLDAGCGDGFWSDIFARRGFLVYGVDSSYEAIHTARHRCMAAFGDGVYEPGLLPVFNCSDLMRSGAAAFTPMLIFARTLPQFYQPTLEPGVMLLANFGKRVAPAGKILLSIYEGDDVNPADFTRHTRFDILAACLTAGVTVVDEDHAAGYYNLLLEPDRRIPRR
jgi:SAM-dependent methyltransferase